MSTEGNKKYTVARKDRMGWRDFIMLVWKMREKQVAYFSNRDRVSLYEAKRLEHEVDEAVLDYLQVINPGHNDTHTHTLI